MLDYETCPRVLRDLIAMTIRDPISPGRFYPADAQLLYRQIEACYLHPAGPGGFPSSRNALQGSLERKPPLALVVPHGALGHSGPIATHAYGLLAAWATANGGALPRWVVLLGPDHRGRGAAVSATALDYATPLGVVPTDAELVRRLCGQRPSVGAASPVVDAPAGHHEEHALENQLPFLQHLAWRQKGEPAAVLPPRQGFAQLPRLLPITMAAQDFATAETLAGLLDAVLPMDDVLLLVTSDMSHCGPLYGNLPYPACNDPGEINTWCLKQRQSAVAAIESMDSAFLIERFHQQHLSMCGLGCVVTAMGFARLRGATSARVLASADSVGIAMQWRQQVPRDRFGNIVYPWNLLSEVDAYHPVGFATLVIA
jgi:predicted class III extradiol MEMO1 family dioxygenase